MAEGFRYVEMITVRSNGLFPGERGEMSGMYDVRLKLGSG